MAKQEAAFERLRGALDMLRGSSAEKPTQAAWMKALVHALPTPVVIESPLAELAAADIFCPTSDRTLRPWPLQTCDQARQERRDAARVADRDGLEREHAPPVGWLLRARAQ